MPCNGLTQTPLPPPPPPPKKRKRKVKATSAEDYTHRRAINLSDAWSISPLPRSVLARLSKVLRVSARQVSAVAFIESFSSIAEKALGYNLVFLVRTNKMWVYLASAMEIRVE